MNRPAVVLSCLLVAVWGCAADTAPERTGSVASALLPPELTPVPCLYDTQTKKPKGPEAWPGTISELLFADALVSCSATTPDQQNNAGLPDPNYWDLPQGDLYAQKIVGYMQQTVGPKGQNYPWQGDLMSTWATMRADTNYACEQVSLAPSLNAVSIPPHPVPEFVGFFNPLCLNNGDYCKTLNKELRLASVNYCVAQTLRRLVPGSAGAESLLFPQHEQREFLEIVRERSQIAMLQYALLGEIFTANISVGNQQTELIAGGLSTFANSGGGAAFLPGMGRDFAGAVQLNHAVADEMSHLLERSRFADRSASPPNASPADRMWGTASWQQRSLAMALGGDPLVIDPTDTTGGWPTVLGTGFPGTYTNMPWPQGRRAPYVTTNVDAPQVHELWLLARKYLDRIRVFFVGTFHGVFDETFSADIDKTATTVYDSVEAQVEYAECYPFDPNPPPQGTCPTTVKVRAPQGQYVLQTRYHVTAENAHTLAALLADEIFTSYDRNLFSPDDPTSSFAGAVDLVGADPNMDTARTSGWEVDLSPKADFVPRALNETAGIYSRATPLRVPFTSEIRNDVDAGSLAMAGPCGFLTTCAAPYANDADEAKRVMGALAADQAVREMLIDAQTWSGGVPQVVQPYFDFATQIVQKVSGAAGTEGVHVVPLVHVQSVPGHYSYYAQSEPYWLVNVTHGADDPFWADPLHTQFWIYAIEGPNATNLAAHPEVAWDGATLYTLIHGPNGAIAKGRYAGNTVSDPAVAGEVREHFLPMQVPDGKGFLLGSRSLSATLVAEACRKNANGKQVCDDRLLVGGVLFANAGTSVLCFNNMNMGAGGDGGGVTCGQGPNPAHYGQDFALSGTLGNWLEHENQANMSNPSEPAYDGFDLPIHWVPPFSAEVLGGNPGDSITNEYLALAQSSADNATKAVQTALDGLLQELQGQANDQAAAARASMGAQQAQDELCGASNHANCDPGFDEVRLSEIPGYPQLIAPLCGNSCPPADTCDNNGNANKDAKTFVDSVVYQLIAPVLATKVEVAKPIRPYLSQAAAPSFSDYDGGSLQQAFIQQWAALRAPIGRIVALQKSGEAVKTQMDAYCAIRNQLTNEMEDKCGWVASGKAILAGISESINVGNGGASVGLSYSPGPLLAQLQSCNDVEYQMGPAQKQVVEAQAQGIASLSTAGSDLSGVEAATVQSGAAIKALVLKTQDAIARDLLEGKLAAATEKTSFGLYRMYTEYDMWRAQALLENSRRYALAARRAIEARYVVDLSRLTQPESFVASPATWADDVFSYDLSMPSAVGLAVPGPDQTQNSGNGIYTNKISDYVNNLQGFVAGYAVVRPAATSRAELDVINLPGLAPGSPMAGLGNLPPQYESLGKWTLHCADSTLDGTWVPVPLSTGDVDNACKGVGTSPQPDRARFEYSLDPWGRVNGFIADVPFQKRFNARWTQLALNFVGTAIKDCTKAQDPQGCYAQAFIPYNLSHAGPSWVTDYDEIWRQLDVPTGQIEGGKGLAAEIWFDPLKDGWSTSYISAIARTEYELRPLGGAYVLEFPVGPEVTLSRIQRIQILIGSSAWVKQQ